MIPPKVSFKITTNPAISTARQPLNLRSDGEVQKDQVPLPEQRVSFVNGAPMEEDVGERRLVIPMVGAPREGDAIEDADYSQVSVEDFGLALLRGTGWKDGEGIGKQKVKVVVKLPQPRPARLGLGAVRERREQVPHPS